MTAEHIMRRYNTGYSTADGLLLDILSQTSKRVVGDALALLSPDMLRELEEFVGYYTPKTIIINGRRPNARTLRFVREWFASRRPAASA